MTRDISQGINFCQQIGFLMSLSTYDCMVYATSFVWEDLERQRKENARTGKDINEITYIFDMEGFSIQDILHKSVLEMALDMGRIVQDYYPEIWGHIFFINVPSYFDTAYNMFKPILRLSVIQKLQVVSKGTDSTMSTFSLGKAVVYR
ncbi:UNVERIFIED_CONTAM: Sec14l2 [Trichonephila clavipes]